ncbi:unnamed protein product, partial [marine sediment metagenome]
IDNAPEKANFLYPNEYDINRIDRGLFSKGENNNQFYFFYYYHDGAEYYEAEDTYKEEHIYDYNYLRLDTSD